MLKAVHVISYVMYFRMCMETCVKFFFFFALRLRNRQGQRVEG